MQNIINIMKRNYLLSIIVIGLLVLSLYSTFAMFTASINTNDIVNLTASNIPTGTETIEYERLTVKAGEKKTIEFTVKNSTSGSLYYGAWYEMIKPTSINGDIQIAKQEDTQNDSLGQLSTGSSAKVSLVVDNGSSSSIIVNIGIAYNSDNEFNLPTNRYLITETYIPTIITNLNISTSNTSYFNNKGKYTVNISCANSIARWDYTNWNLVVSSLQNSDTCSTTFTSRSDNLSQYIINRAGTTQGDGQVVNEKAYSPNYTNSTPITQSSYTNMSTYYSSSSSSTSGTTTSNSFTFSGNSWSSIPSNLTSNQYYHAKFRVSTSGYYQVCYTMSNGNSSNRLYIYRGTTQQYINGSSYLSASTSSSKNGCVDIGYVDTNTDVKIVQRAYSNTSYPIATVTFNLKKAASIDNINAGYRYEGKNHNNYVIFNVELWRIIGVFDSNTHGQSGNLTKIIRNESIGSYAWSGDGFNNWSRASLNTILNTYYYNSQNGTEQTACYFYGSYSTKVQGNCDFRYTGLDANARGMIEEVTWHLGGYSSDSATAEAFYGFERGESVVFGNPTTATGYIGLMYPSDYGYSVLASSCARTTNLDRYNSSSCGGESWLLKDGYEWTMTQLASSSMLGMFFVDNFANLNSRDMSFGLAVRPTAYLKSSVYIVSGDGSEANPYVIAE